MNHEKSFSPNSIFCNFKNGQKSIFEPTKSLKLPNMQFHEKKFDLFDFTIFLPGIFLIFWPSCCGHEKHPPKKTASIYPELVLFFKGIFLTCRAGPADDNNAMPPIAIAPKLAMTIGLNLLCLELPVASGRSIFSSIKK